MNDKQKLKRMLVSAMRSAGMIHPHIVDLPRITINDPPRKPPRRRAEREQCNKSRLQLTKDQIVTDPSPQQLTLL